MYETMGKRKDKDGQRQRRQRRKTIHFDNSLGRQGGMKLNARKLVTSRQIDRNTCRCKYNRNRDKTDAHTHTHNQTAQTHKYAHTLTQT